MNVLILIDLINEMVDPNGKLAGKGYADFVKTADFAGAVEAWRSTSEVDRVIHVGLEFRANYADAATRSRLLDTAPECGVARQGSAGASFVEWASPREGDIVIRKQRIPAFYGSGLELVLRRLGATSVTIGGVATDLAVSSAARDAHNRDFDVRVAPSLCIAASLEDHEAALQHIAKFARLV